MTNSVATIGGVAASRGSRSTPRSPLGIWGFVSRFTEMRELARQRAALSRLSPEHLRDIGLDADSARVEADRPAWDAPQTWR